MSIVLSGCFVKDSKMPFNTKGAIRRWKRDLYRVCKYMCLINHIRLYRRNA